MPSPTPSSSARLHQVLGWVPTTLFALLALGSVVNVILDRVDTEDLTRRPAVRPAGLAWLEVEGLEPFLKDRVAFRTAIRQAHGRLLWITGDGNENVVRGESGWLFYADSLDRPGGPHWLPRRPARSVVRLAEMVEASGRRLLVVVAPNKATVYPDFLRPAAGRQQALNDGRLARVRTLARQRARGTFVDLFDLLREQAARSPDPDSTLYYPTDTHWNVRGATVAAKEIVTRLGGQWEPAALEITDTQGRLDLPGLLGLPGDGPRLSAVVKREGVQTESTPFGFDWQRHESRSDGAPLLPKLLVFQDSFGNALRMLLPAYFEEVTFLTQHAEINGELETAVDEAEIVVVVMVERTFVKLSGQYPAPLWERTRQLFERLERPPVRASP